MVFSTTKIPKLGNLKRKRKRKNKSPRHKEKRRPLSSFISCNRTKDKGQNFMVKGRLQRSKKPFLGYFPCRKYPSY